VTTQISSRLLTAVWANLIRVLILAVPTACAGDTKAPDALWLNGAHFSQVGNIEWTPSRENGVEQAGWFAVHGGTWYAFNRMQLPKASYCPQDHDAVVVRSSKDRGRSWSTSSLAVEPGDSKAGDGCAVLDGSVYYDAKTAIWHLLAQCLDRQNQGGWGLCHYQKRGGPSGRFVPDPANPVVRGGALWSRICAGTGKACPTTTMDEGTPDIVEKKDGMYIVTIHGFDAASKAGYRGVVATADFRRWSVAGNGLPNDATLGPADCRAWMANCTGVGQSTTFSDPRYRYMVVETMDKGLLCTTGQNWVFELVRSSAGAWPRSGRNQWAKLPGGAFLAPIRPQSETLCKVRYARWIIDGADVFLVYEDWSLGNGMVRRPLLKLIHDDNLR